MQNSWEITEPAIYYQAAYVRLLANFVNQSSISTASENIKASSNCVEIFPNPSGNYFHIKGILDRYKLEVYDAVGNLQQEIPYVGSEAVVNMSSLPSGTYLIKIENKFNSDLCIQKILKE